MAYTPELSTKHSCALRRMAWALNMPMTKAMQMVFDATIPTLDKNAICNACKDKKNCLRCIFAHPPKTTNPMDKLTTTPYVFITISSGIIEKVVFIRNQTLALNRLHIYARQMDWEKCDAAVYGPRGLLANAKMVIEEPHPTPQAINT